VTTPGRGRLAVVAAARGFRSTRGYKATAVPVRIEIPRIGVASALVRLGRGPDRTVEVPARWEVAGWYAPGTRPGDPGSAVILGHVDSKRGPAVFFRLRELRRGDEIRVVRADGSTVRFAVERTRQYGKRRFPTDEVYYPTLTPALRLRRRVRRDRRALPVERDRVRHAGGVSRAGRLRAPARRTGPRSGGRPPARGRTWTPRRPRPAATGRAAAAAGRRTGPGWTGRAGSGPARRSPRAA
jgi:hypothetical protein